MDVLMHVFWLCQTLLQRTQMKHEKCNKKIQYIETLPLNPFKFEKIHQTHQYSIKGGL